MSIHGSSASRFTQSNIEKWWETAKKTVMESIYRHRNNTIKKIKLYSKVRTLHASIATIQYKTSNTLRCLILILHRNNTAKKRQIDCSLYHGPNNCLEK